MIPETSNPNGSLGINCVDINNFKTQVCDITLVPDAEKKRANPPPLQMVRAEPQGSAARKEI